MTSGTFALDDAVGEEDEVEPAAADELELELEEQPATVRTVMVNAPETPTRRRRRLRRFVRFMAPSVRSPGIAEMSTSWPSDESMVTTWE
jgi:hypothetical protein